MTFTYWGAELDLFDHLYNTTIRNERAVEIPIALAWLNGRTGRGLEVGNVLGHYGLTGHRVVDLHEGPEHLDVFDIAGTYDWVVSISTVEHVRWDEPPIDPYAASKAIDHLAGLLKPAGAMLVTVPIGYHGTLDAHLIDGGGAQRSCTLVSSGGRWEQTERRTIRAYGPWANSVWIGEYGGET